MTQHAIIGIPAHKSTLWRITRNLKDMNTLQRHVVKEILVPFILAFMVITVLMLTGNLLKELADRFMNRALGLNEIGVMVLYLLPTLAVYTIPISLLFATLVAFLRFSQDHEIIAMQAAGIPMRRIFAPAIVVGFITALFMLALWAEISPRARKNLKRFVVETILKKPTLVLSEQTWTKEINNMRIFVGKIDNDKMLLNDVSVMVKDEDGPHRTIVADSGRIFVGTELENIFLELSNGSIHEYDSQHPDQYSTTTFGKLTIPVNIYAIERYLRPGRQIRDRTRFRTSETPLIQAIRMIFDPSLPPRERQYIIRHIGERTALAFMPLTFVLIGAPLGIIPYRTRRFYGLAICAVLLLAYYSLLIVGETLAKKEIINPLLAMWTPNLLLGTAGIIFMVRAERR